MCGRINYVIDLPGDIIKGSDLKKQREKNQFKSGAITKASAFILRRKKFTLGDVVRKSRRRGG